MLRQTLVLAIALIAAPALAAPQQQGVGKETSISFAGNGGLRNWQAGPRGSNRVYVQDRRLRWYAVQLSGDCIRGNNGSPTFRYTTDANGRFDTFSRVSSSDTPYAVCAVESIKTSLPPAGQPGAKARRR
jgi:hypothetical protein